MRIFTASFWSPDIPGSDLAPIAISHGLPKAPLPYHLAGHVRWLALSRAEWTMDETDPDAAQRMYAERLDRLGVGACTDLLVEVAGASTPGVAVLCYEHDASRCHREWFGRWWSARTGQPVIELARPRPRSRGQNSSGTSLQTCNPYAGIGRAGG